MLKRKKISPTRQAKNHMVFSYKEVGTLEKYLTEQGYIVPRYKSGLTQKSQRQLAREIKRARHLALLPFTQTL